jgi:hypothetical protein
VSDRANFSQGAAGYVVQILDKTSPHRALLSTRVGISPERLQSEFCRALASTDSKEYNRGVGKVHIVDMLTEALHRWPDAPNDGVVRSLVAGATKTAAVGDKPKALAFLDALAACRELSNHRLNIQAGLGKRLGERLCSAAAEAPNNRIYHPARIVHDKIVTLIDMGVSPEHTAFPRKLFEDYLKGAAQATSDEQRLALERYVRILRRLHAAGLSLERPGIERFALAMRDRLDTKRDFLAMGANELDRLLLAHQSPGGKIDAKTIDRALAEWTNEATAQ